MTDLVRWQAKAARNHAGTLATSASLLLHHRQHGVAMCMNLIRVRLFCAPMISVT
jgi:hypothetical protein